MKPRSELRSRDLIVVGPTPPPLHGVAFATVHVLDAVQAAGRLAAHLETSDPRPVTTTGRLDLTNVTLALSHTARLARLLARHRDADVYLPLSQGRWGFVRDAVFVALAKLARRRVIAHLHGGHFDRFYESSSRLERGLIRAVMRRIDQVWVLTPAHLEILDGLVPAERVRMLENTATDMRLSGRAPVSDGDARFRILYLSNLVPEKGCFDLLDAIAHLGSRAAGLRVRLVGEADAAVAEEVGRRADALADLDVRVELAGPLTGATKAQEYVSADLFVYPSRYPPEGQPLVLIEALSAGLPVVTTDHSGIPFTVRDRREGLIVPPGDVRGIAEAIHELRANSDLRRSLGSAGREHYEDRYRPERFNRAVHELLGGP